MFQSVGNVCELSEVTQPVATHFESESVTTAKINTINDRHSGTRQPLNGSWTTFYVYRS